MAEYRKINGFPYSITSDGDNYKTLGRMGPTKGLGDADEVHT